MIISLEWSNVLTPKAQKVIDMRRDKSKFLHTDTWAHDGIYEINSDKKYVVTLATRTYSCRVWLVSGLSCSHAIATVDHRHEDITNFCDVYFTVQMYHKAYSFPFNPIPDALELSEIVHTIVLSPAARRTTGRSKKRRRKIEYKEIRPLKCSRYGVMGHN
ncbi:hypothetical protein AMTR_s00011p00204880 [Amborella trichopoda]|uniref:Zinc finger PMZ-type domain-containing protein n=1 Tax=Amborella trichopoda TaxID=13333 RepID=W1NHI0_AMBTC|nr:hypothetical protein AMTR_s00011p00204880 [Amborella trichopoda]